MSQAVPWRPFRGHRLIATRLHFNLPNDFYYYNHHLLPKNDPAWFILMNFRTNKVLSCFSLGGLQLCTYDYEGGTARSVFSVSLPHRKKA